jgi:hypothetical protein
MAACRLMPFVSKASAAESFLSRCGSKRRAPECSSHGSPVAAPQVVQRTEFICFTVSSLVFISIVVFLLRRWLNRQEENIPFCSAHLPAENFLESALNFFGVKQFLTGLIHAQEDRAKATEKTVQY